MQNKNDDTTYLWRMAMVLIHLVFLFILLGLGYLLGQEQLHAFLNKPKLSQTQLEEFSKQRAIARKQERENNWNLVENGIHVKTGLKDDTHLKLVIGACTSCHSSKLIIQNRATREGWKGMIDWMQETQNLVDLGDKEVFILDYLEKHYAPHEVGRRENLDLDEIEWYILHLE